MRLTRRVQRRLARRGRIGVARPPWGDGARRCEAEARLSELDANELPQQPRRTRLALVVEVGARWQQLLDREANLRGGVGGGGGSMGGVGGVGGWVLTASSTLQNARINRPCRSLW